MPKKQRRKNQGRHPLPNDERRGRYVRAWLTDAQWGALESYAPAQTPGQSARQILAAALEGTLR